MPYYQNFLANASNLAQTPFNPAMYGSVAPLNATQYQAGAMLTNDIPGAVTDAMAAGRAAGTWDPAQVRAIESPYTEDVVNATQNWFNNQNAIQGTDLLSQGIRTGNAFGGDRAGIAAAQLAGQQQLAEAPVIAGLRQAGYTQALNEYNTLKQLGLTGAQMELQAPLMGAGALMGWGQQQQQQSQRELDVAQQNAMMASAYPFQTANWYGSILGGIGPLEGSFAQGYTTPPSPNLLNQGIGIASSLVGLGTSLFGKDGGPVELKRGGLVPIVIPRRDGGAVVVPFRRAKGGLVPVRSFYMGGLARRTPRQRSGLGKRLPPRFQAGGDTTTIDATTPNIQFASVPGGGSGTYDLSGGSGTDVGMDTVDERRRLGLTPMAIPKYKGPPDAGDWIQRRMRDTKQQTQDPNDLASTIGNVAKLAVKAAPLFAMLERGGSVKHYADGEDVEADDEDETDDEDTGTVPVAGRMPVSLDTGSADMPSLIQAAYRAGPAGGREGAEQDFLTGRESAGPQPQPGLTQRGTGASVREIPGLGAPPRTYAQRLAVNPFWNAGIAMLGSRSPYFGQGLAAGMLGATSAIERGRKEDLLDQKPQMIDDGKTIKYRSGNRLIDTGIASPKAGRSQERWDIERMKEEGRMERQRMRSSGKPSTAQTEATSRFHMRALQKQLDAIKDDPERDQKAHDLVDAYNKQWGTNFNVPAAPAKPEGGAAAPGRGAFGRLWDWLSTAITGSGAPAKAEPAAPAAPAAPAETPPAAPAAPATPPAAKPAAPAAPAAEAPRDLGGAIKSGAITREQAIAQARAAARRNPGAIDMITDRLRKAGITNFGDLLQGTPATPAR